MATTIDFGEAIESGGGAEQVRQGLVDFQRRARQLDAQMVQLIQEHPLEWVAMPEGDGLVFAPSHSELLGRVRAAGAPTNSAVIKFLDPEPKTMIL